MAINLKLQRAEIQRYIALKKAFETIDSFVIPSLPPHYDYEKMKHCLLDLYSEGIDRKELKKYIF